MSRLALPWRRREVPERPYGVAQVGLAQLLDGGVNLLPYRQLRTARLRRRRALEFALAACLGLFAALATIAWQQIHATQAGVRQAQLKRRLHALQPGLAEHDRLAEAIAARARRAAWVAGLAVARDDLFHLLYGIGQDPIHQVKLARLHFLPGRANVDGSAADQSVLNEWMRRLTQTIGLDSVEITHIQKPGATNLPQLPARTAGEGAADAIHALGPAAIDFSLQIGVGEMPASAAPSAVLPSAAPGSRASKLKRKIPAHVARPERVPQARGARDE